MPRRPLKVCCYPGCSNLVEHGYCKQHDRAVASSFQRDKARQNLYSTRRWKLRRAAQLAKEPWCAECLRDGIYVVATDADHIERHEGDPVRFYIGNLQSLCHACHSRKTAIETGISVKGRGGEKVLSGETNSAVWQPYEKKSQCGESG